MVRPRMIRILFGRELKRLKKNPSALMLIGLLAAIALLAAFSGPTAGDATTTELASSGNVLVVYDRYTDQLKQVIRSRPDHAGHEVKFIARRHVERGDKLVAPADWSIVEFRNAAEKTNAPGEPAVTVTAHYLGSDPNILNPFWDWFSPALASTWGTTLWVDQKLLPRTEFFGAKPIQSSSLSELVKTEVIGTTLLLMVQFFACCHLLVSFTAEDRERKTLNALALSPAGLSEIMLAKAGFHMCLSVAGCVLITAIISPAALTRPLLWATILMTSVAMMSVGTCIATLAKNQAAAGMLALCYMMAGAILFFLSTKLFAFRILRGFSFESYTFPLLFYVFKYPDRTFFPLALVPLFALTAMWMFAARTCFYRFGWRD